MRTSLSAAVGLGMLKVRRSCLFHRDQGCPCLRASQTCLSGSGNGVTLQAVKGACRCPNSHEFSSEKSRCQLSTCGQDEEPRSWLAIIIRASPLFELNLSARQHHYHLG